MSITPNLCCGETKTEEQTPPDNRKAWFLGSTCAFDSHGFLNPFPSTDSKTNELGSTSEPQPNILNLAVVSFTFSLT